MRHEQELADGDTAPRGSFYSDGKFRTETAAASGPCGACAGGYLEGQTVAIYNRSDAPVMHVDCARRLAFATWQTGHHEDADNDPHGMLGDGEPAEP